MADQTIGITISAVNTTGPEFDKVRKNLQDVDKSTRGLGESASGMGRHFTSLASTIGGQLNPQLAQSAAFMAILHREGSRVSLGMTTFAVSAAVAVGALVEFNRVVTAAASRHVDLARALASNDFASATGQLTKAVTELRVQTEIISAEPLRKFFDDISKTLSRFGITSGGFLEGILGTTQQQKAVSEARAAFEKTLPTEMFLRAAKATQDYEAAQLSLSRLMLQSATEQGSVTKAHLAQADAIEALTRKQEAETAALLKQQQAESGALAFNYPGGVPVGVSGRLASAQLDAREALGRKQLAESRALEKSDEDAILAIKIAQLSTIREIVKIQGAFETKGSTGPGMSMSATAVTEAQLADLDKVIEKLKARGNSEKEILGLLAAQAQLLAIQSGRLGAQGEIALAGIQHGAIGGNAAAQYAAAIAAEESKRATALAQAGLLQNPTDRDLAIQRATAQSDTAMAKLRFDERTRTSPLAGLAMGFQDVTDEFQAAGAVMREGIRSLGTDMQRTFSSTFFDVITGNFKKLSDLPTALAKNILASISDVFSKQLVGSLFSQVSGGMRSFVGLGGGVFGGGQGGLVEVGGRLFQSAQTAGGQQVLVPVGGGSGGGFGTMGFSGGGGLLGGTNIGAFLNTPISALGSLGSDAVISGGQLITNAGEYAMAGVTSEGLAGASGAMGAMTVGQALSVTGAALAFGYTLYNASKKGQTAESIWGSAASGAISGAVMGGSVGGPYGAVIGAVAGGAIAGGVAAFNKGEVNPRNRSERAASAAAANLMGAIDGASTLEDLRGVLNRSWSEHGEIVIVSYDRETHWTGSWTNGPAGFLAYPAAGMPYPSLDLMQTDPRYVQNLEIQVGQSGAPIFDATVTRHFQEKWRQVGGGIESVLVGYDQALFGGAVTRSTLLPGSRLSQVPAGAQLSVFGNTLPDPNDPAYVALLNTLARVDADYDLKIINRDGDVQAVTVGRYSGGWPF